MSDPVAPSIFENFFSEFFHKTGYYPSIQWVNILFVSFGIIFHTLCYLYIVPFVLSYVSSTYRDILRQNQANHAPGASIAKKRQSVEWDSRGVSNIHAIITFACASYAIFFEGITTDYNIFKVSQTLVPTLSFSLGYFLYDFFLVLKYFSEDKGMILHHIIAIVCFSASCFYRAGYLFCLFYLFTEISTPFVNQRVYFSEANMRESNLYLANGFMMWLTFLLFRIPMVFVIPVFLFRTMHDFYAVPRFLFVLCMINYVLISFLNIMWFYKISQGLFKALFSKSEKIRKIKDLSKRTSLKEKPSIILHRIPGYDNAKSE
jgi:hypothetical protein